MMPTKKFKTDDAKFTGYGSIDIARGLFRHRLDKACSAGNHPLLKVTIEATIYCPINSCDDVGQEYALEVGKVKFK